MNMLKKDNTWTPENITKLFEDSRARLEQVECDRRNFLRQCGWKYTSDTPGNVWMWEKKLPSPDGRMTLVDESTALAFEEVWANDAVEAECDK